MLIPLLIAVAAFQGAVPLARVGASYLAIDARLSVAAIGFVSAAFAVLPIFLAVIVGRLGDRGNYGALTLAGALILSAGIIGLWLAATSLPVLIVMTAMLGIGHMLLLNSTQLFLTREAGTRARDSLIGYYMISTSLGHIVGPLIASWVVTDDAGSGSAILAVCVLLAVPLIVCAILLFRMGRPAAGTVLAPPIPLGSIIRIKGLGWVVMTSSLVMAANDILVVFLPVLAHEQGIPPATVALVLTVRSIVTLLSRLVFARLIALIGRAPLTISSTMLAGLAFILIAIPLGVPGMYATVSIAGFGLGIAMPMTLSMTFAIAPPAAYGATTSLRTTASRFMQFVVPLGAGAAASVTGPGSIFAAIGVLLVTTAAAGLRR